MRKTILLYILISIVFFLASYFHKDAWLHPWRWIILGFFFCTSWLTNLLTEQGMANNRENFTQFYLSSVSIRMVGSMIFVAVALYVKAADSRLFLANFFALYLCFTLFEIISIVRNLQRFS